MFKFAVYYLFDKTIKVESTSLILGSDQFTQVASQPDLDDNANWIEIKWPTRKEPNRTVPAKVLLFGGKYGEYDSYKELVSKKNFFLLGKDIWAEEESRGVRMKKKMCETDVVKPKTAIQAKQTRIKEAARDQVLQNLKTSLSQKRALDTQDHLYRSENESPQCVHWVAASDDAAMQGHSSATSTVKMDPVVVKVIIDHHSEKLTLSSGMPNTVEQLHKTVKDTFQIHEEFTLHYFDEDFGDFFTIHSTNEVKDKGTIKVVIIPSIVLSLATPETENVADADNVNAEFHRITAVNLEAKFMFMLYHYTPKLLAIFQAKKGAAGERHRTEMNIVLQSGIPIEKTREVVIRCLIDHLGEDVGVLIKEIELSAIDDFQYSPYSNL
ncbi:hypothetical protein ABVT39_021549 [Epinephelus coioides]